jgi:hypothetical protein
LCSHRMYNFTFRICPSTGSRWYNLPEAASR